MAVRFDLYSTNGAKRAKYRAACIKQVQIPPILTDDLLALGEQEIIQVDPPSTNGASIASVRLLSSEGQLMIRCRRQSF